MKEEGVMQDEEKSYRVTSWPAQLKKVIFLIFSGAQAKKLHHWESEHSSHIHWTQWAAAPGPQHCPHPNPPWPCLLALGNEWISPANEALAFWGRLYFPGSVGLGCLSACWTLNGQAAHIPVPWPAVPIRRWHGPSLWGREAGAKMGINSFNPPTCDCREKGNVKFWTRDCYIFLAHWSSSCLHGNCLREIFLFVFLEDFCAVTRHCASSENSVLSSILCHGGPGLGRAGQRVPGQQQCPCSCPGLCHPARQHRTFLLLFPPDSVKLCQSHP